MAKLIKVPVKYGKTDKEKEINFNKALKRWKRKFEEAEIKEELISRKEFVKPSLKKRIQKQQTVRENQKLVKLQKLEDGKK